MAYLTEKQKEILYNYRDDLKSNYLDNFVMMLEDTYSNNGEPSDERLDAIVAYMLEHKIPLLRKLTNVGISDYTLPTLIIPPNVENISIHNCGGLEELKIMSPNLKFVEIIQNGNLKVIDAKYMPDLADVDGNIMFNNELEKIIVRDDFGYISGIPEGNNHGDFKIYCRKDSILGKYLTSDILYNSKVNLNATEDDWYLDHTIFI